ncbi:MAG: hypothetical protein NTW54_02115 [Bacteroidetes bacterium]|nr:hypothetical protein [Bacteroidota bacterium]
MRQIIVILGLCIAMLSNGQSYDESFAVQGVALGNQSVTMFNAFAPVGNPAMTTNSLTPKSTSFGIMASNRFFLKNLKLGGFGIVHKFSKSDALGLVIQFDGTVNFRQNTIALAYSKKINEKFAVGISILYLNTFEQTIGSINNFLTKAGLIFRPSKQFLVGATVYNPFASKLTQYTHERIPTIISTGVCYSLSKQVNVYTEYKLGWNSLRVFKMGIAYAPQSNLVIYAGFQTSNAPLSFGISIKTKIININIASQYHQILGFSPALGFDYSTN